MKKVLGVLAVAFAVTLFAVAVFAEGVKVVDKVTEKKGEIKETTKITQPGMKEKIKTTVTKEGATTVIKEKDALKKETEKIVENPAGTDVKVKDVAKYKKGEIWKDTVFFHKYEANGDYIYVMKDDKVVRLKHSLSDNAKKEMMQRKHGDKITITSTYPLTNADLAVITNVENAK